MISEVVNALFITYVGTEYLLKSHNMSTPHRGILQSRKYTGAAILLILLINVLDRVVAFNFLQKFNEFLHGFFHLPKVTFAATAYIFTLYFDCKKASPKLTPKHFFSYLGKAACRILPIYPFLAIFISFGFMFLIAIFEKFNIPLEWLNWPIYYGTVRTRWLVLLACGMKMHK